MTIPGNTRLRLNSKTISCGTGLEQNNPNLFGFCPIPLKPLFLSSLATRAHPRVPSDDMSSHYYPPVTPCSGPFTNHRTAPKPVPKDNDQHTESRPSFLHSASSGLKCPLQFISSHGRQESNLIPEDFM